MINEHPNAYIGITDFEDKSQVEAMLTVLREASWGRFVRKLGVGVMMSYKTLNDLPSKFSCVFPRKKWIAEIFLADSLAYNILHYADYEGIDVLKNLTEAVEWGGPNLHAIQLDMVWPEPEIIRQFRELHPDVQLIIQINQSALLQVDYDPIRLADQLKEYGPSLNGALLDMSMGRGVAMSWLELLPYLACLHINLPQLQLVVAGGLGPDSLNLVQPLLDCFVPEISIDAQAQLRNSGNILESINWQMAGNYLAGAVKMFNQRWHRMSSR